MLPIPSSLQSENAIAGYAINLEPEPHQDAFAELEALENGAPDSNFAKCCVSGLWLLNNFLHRSHDLSQDIHTPEGSWLHAIMHRTEGDFSNSKYWYRRAGEHPAMTGMDEPFDPYDFVDQCQSEYRKGLLTKETQALAFAEWEALFDFCHANS